MVNQVRCCGTCVSLTNNNDGTFSCSSLKSEVGIFEDCCSSYYESKESQEYVLSVYELDVLKALRR